MDGCVFPLTLQVMSITLIILIGLTSVDCSKLPCYFFDSINITDGIQQPNGSIQFDGIDFPHKQYAVLNYIIDNGERKACNPHFRGCLCNIKPCFRLCCSDKVIKETTINLDHNCNEELSQMEEEVIDEKHKYINLFLGQQPIDVKNRTCKQFFIEGEIKRKIKNVSRNSNYVQKSFKVYTILSNICFCRQAENYLKIRQQPYVDTVKRVWTMKLLKMTWMSPFASIGSRSLSRMTMQRPKFFSIIWNIFVSIMKLWRECFITMLLIW